MKKKLPWPLAVAAAALLSLPVHSADLAPATVSVAAGPGRDHSSQLTVGLGWNFDWQRPLGPVLATTHAEVFAAVWRARDFEGGNQHFGHFGVLPTLRLRFDQGRSPMFFDAGIGLSWHNRTYVTPDKEMGSRFNFTDVLGVGFSFGPQRRQELSLRYNHVSNGGIKKPNPGEDFLLLRYATHF